jgi:carbonic anhydrase
MDAAKSIYTGAKLIIATCMDHRITLKLPDKFAFIIRTGGANIQYSHFHISYALAVGNISHIALIGHTDCGMVNLEDRKQQFIEGLSLNTGWDKKEAITHFEKDAPEFEVGDVIQFTIRQKEQLETQYLDIQVAPILYKVEDNRLYLIQE